MARVIPGIRRWSVERIADIEVSGWRREGQRDH